MFQLSNKYVSSFGHVCSFYMPLLAALGGAGLNTLSEGEEGRCWLAVYFSLWLGLNTLSVTLPILKCLYASLEVAIFRKLFIASCIYGSCHRTGSHLDPSQYQV